MYSYPLLLIDVSSDEALVALAIGDNVIKKTISIGPTIGDGLLKTMDSLTKDVGVSISEIKRIALVVVSNKYSALRAAISTAEGLGISNGCELVEVESGNIDEMIENAYKITPIVSFVPKYRKNVEK